MSDLKTKVLIGTKETPIRFSYAHVFTAKAINEGDTPKYSVSLIISKDDKEMIAKIKKAIKNAFENGKAKLGKIKFDKLPKTFRYPLRDGDEERPDDEAYENSYFVNANTQRKPGIVDADREEIIDADEFYSGCLGRATVNFYAFDFSGNKGIAAGLNNLQKLEDGERLSGGSSAADDFADEDDDLL